MKGSKWLILVVVLIVIGVVVAKEMRNSPSSPEPEVVAQTPGEGEPALSPAEAEPTEKETAAAAEPVEQEQVTKPEPSSAAAKPAGKERPNASEEAKAPDKPAANPGPERPGEQPGQKKRNFGPKPEGPLPGSKLKPCLKNGLPTMADFGMGTCQPCKVMEPILKQATQDYWGRANILFVELDKYSDLAREYGIRVMPTQIFFDASGKQVDSHMGFMDREEIDRRLTALGVK